MALRAVQLASACRAQLRRCLCRAAARPRTRRPEPQLRSLMTAAARDAAPRSSQLGSDIPCRLQQVPVAGEQRFLLLPDDEAVMDMYIASGLGDRDPYWVEPWPSAFFLAAELAARPELVAGATVAELGCGVGLAGAAAAAAGAASVLLLDREPLALQCALLNAALSGHSTAPPPPAAAPLPDPHALLRSAAAAGTPAEPAAALPDWLLKRAATAGAGGSTSGSSGDGAPGCLVSAAVYDWAAPPALKPVDVVLAADVLYEAFSVEPVAEVARRLVKRSGGRLLLTDPPNRTPQNRERFLDLLCGNGGGFVLEENGLRSVRVPSIGSGGSGKESEAQLQFLVLRRAPPGDTVGLKRRPPSEP